MTDINNSDVIIALWKKFTLQSDDMTLDFFESGGDSLSAINMIVDLQNHFKIQLSLEAFMRNPYLHYLQGAIKECHHYD